jgi:Na+/melibiose symporter-like transporter
MGSAFIYAAIATSLLFYCTDAVGLNAGIIGTIIFSSKIFDSITDLLMGSLTAPKTRKSESLGFSLSYSICNRKLAAILCPIGLGKHIAVYFRVCDL